MNKTMVKRNLNSMLKDTAGLSTVEYIIILVLIAIVGMAAWKAFGTSVRARVSESTTQVNGLSASAR